MKQLKEKKKFPTTEEAMKIVQQFLKCDFDDVLGVIITKEIYKKGKEEKDRVIGENITSPYSQYPKTQRVLELRGDEGYIISVLYDTKDGKNHLKI